MYVVTYFKFLLLKIYNQYLYILVLNFYLIDVLFAFFYS